jgi:lipoic acid synthetase
MLPLPTLETPTPARRLPAWLKRELPRGNGNFFTEGLLRELRLETVCENARCPNRPECYSRRTATFMILGNVCTRPCGFCSVPRGAPENLEDDEPARVAEAALRLGLKHVVITSVTRDDLPDGGADHFHRCILAVRERTGAVVEVLTPDFLGDLKAIDCVLEARPEVYNHNMETVPRLYKKVRGRAEYQRSLDLLAHDKKQSPETVTKSGLMLGLGEATEELLDVLADLRGVRCDTLTLGQYLAPTLKHIPVARYVPPAWFMKEIAWWRSAPGAPHSTSPPRQQAAWPRNCSCRMIHWKRGRCWDWWKWRSRTSPNHDQQSLES